MIHLILSPRSRIDLVNQSAGAVMVRIDGLIGPSSQGAGVVARFRIPEANVLDVATALRDSRQWRSPVQIRGPVLETAPHTAEAEQPVHYDVAGLTVSRPGGWHEGILCVSLVPAEPRFEQLIRDLAAAHDAVAA